MKSSKYTLKHELLFCLLTTLAIAAIYGQVIDHEFLSWDDYLYVSENPYVQNGLTSEGLKWAFNFDNQEKTYWHPFTWLSHMLDVSMFGNQAGLHLLINVVWHMLNACLLFIALHRATHMFWPSALVASFFAVHPLNVETVAWIAERKNLLSTFFWMLSITAYIFYAKGPNLKRYMLLVVIFVFGLLSKPMLATLPFVFLLLDYWPLKRIAPDLYESEQKQATFPEILKQIFVRFLEKVPLLCITVLVIYLVVATSEDKNHMIAYDMRPLALRVENIFVSYVLYIKKALFPVDLIFFYPYPKFLPFAQALFCFLLLTFITYGVLGPLRKQKYIMVGWFWFLGTLTPVSGLIQSGRWPALADRWAYVPIIGLFIIFAWGAEKIFSRSRFQQQLLRGVSVLIAITLGSISWNQVQFWKDSETLFRHALQVNPESKVAHYNLASVLSNRGDIDEAIKHYYRAIELDPEDKTTRSVLVYFLNNQGRDEEAQNMYQKGISTMPDGFAKDDSVLLRHNRANNEEQDTEKLAQKENSQNEGIDNRFRRAQQMEESGLLDEAVEQYIQIIESVPNHFAALNNLAMLYGRLGKKDLSILYYQKALQIAPNNAELHYNFAYDLASAGRKDEAAKHFFRALEINPLFVDAHINFGIIIAQQNNAEKAVYHFSRAVEIDPNSLNGHVNLGVMYYQLGQIKKAHFHLQKAIKIDPDNQQLKRMVKSIFNDIEF